MKRHIGPAITAVLALHLAGLRINHATASSPLILRAHLEFKVIKRLKPAKDHLAHFLRQLQKSAPELKIEFRATKDRDSYEYIASRQQDVAGKAASTDAGEELFRILINPPNKVELKTPPLPIADFNNRLQLIHPVLKHLEELSSRGDQNPRAQKSISLSLGSFKRNPKKFLNFLIYIHDHPELTHAVDPYGMTHQSLVISGEQNSFLNSLDKIRYLSEKEHGLKWEHIESQLYPILEYSAYEFDEPKPDFAVKERARELYLSFFGTSVDTLQKDAETVQEIFESAPKNHAWAARRWDLAEYVKEFEARIPPSDYAATLAEIKTALQDPQNERQSEAMRLAQNISWWNKPEIHDLIFKQWSLYPDDDSFLEIAPIQDLPKFRAELLRRLASDDPSKSNAAKRLLAGISWDRNMKLRHAAMALLRDQDPTFSSSFRVSRELASDPEYQSILKAQLASETLDTVKKALAFLEEQGDSTGMTVRPFDADIAAILKKMEHHDGLLTGTKEGEVAFSAFALCSQLPLESFPRIRQAIAEAMVSSKREYANFAMRQACSFELEPYPDLKRAFLRFLFQADHAQKLLALPALEHFSDWRKLPQLKSLVVELMQPPYQRGQWEALSTVLHRSSAWENDAIILKALEIAKPTTPGDIKIHEFILETAHMAGSTPSPGTTDEKCRQLLSTSPKAN